MDNILRVGDIVLWRGAFGRDPAREAVVEKIELIEEEGSKYGTAVESAPWSRLHGRHAVIDFGNHWAYAEQIAPLRGQEDEPEYCYGSHRDTGRGVCADCGEFLERGDR
jgi:hypothetical protein